MINDLKKILPKENILTSIEERYAYSQDASNLQEVENLADIVLFVETIEQVISIVEVAKKHKTPIICRGAGTNVVGACVPVRGGIVMNFSKMDKILEINKNNMTVKVQPGVVVGDLQKAVEDLGLFYPPDPSCLAVSTIGGSIAQSSGGARTFKYGSTKDYVLDLLVVTANGELLRTGSETIKNATGYHLSNLFVGSEGTLGIIVQATMKLILKPEAKMVMLAYFDTVRGCVQAVNKIIEAKMFPATIDFMDQKALQTVENFHPIGLLCDKAGALLVEVDGFECSIEYQQKTIVEILKSSGASAIEFSKNEEEYDKIWTARRSSMAACAKLKPNVTTDDLIVPRERLTELVEGIISICDKYNLVSCVIGHVGDGSVHPQIPIDYNDKDECRRYKLAKEEIYDLTAKLGGLLSGEHGIGILKKDYINKVLDETTIKYMGEIKKVFDPEGILNPEKIFQ